MQTKEKNSRGRDSGVQKCEPVRFPFKNQETVSELGFCAPKTSEVFVSSAWLKLQMSDTVVGFMLVFAIAVAIKKKTGYCQDMQGLGHAFSVGSCGTSTGSTSASFCSNKKNKQDPSSLSILRSYSDLKSKWFPANWSNVPSGSQKPCVQATKSETEFFALKASERWTLAYSDTNNGWPSFMHNQKAASLSCQRQFRCFKRFYKVFGSKIPKWCPCAPKLRSLRWNFESHLSLWALPPHLQPGQALWSSQFQAWFSKPRALRKHQPGLNRRFLEQGTGISRRDSWFDPRVPSGPGNKKKWRGRGTHHHQSVLSLILCCASHIGIPILIRNPAYQREAAKFPSLASSAGRSPNSARSAGLSKHSLSSTAKTFWTISGFALPRQFFTQDSKPCAAREHNWLVVRVKSLAETVTLWLSRLELLHFVPRLVAKLVCLPKERTYEQWSDEKAGKDIVSSNIQTQWHRGK